MRCYHKNGFHFDTTDADAMRDHLESHGIIVNLNVQNLDSIEAHKKGGLVRS